VRRHVAALEVEASQLSALTAALSAALINLDRDPDPTSSLVEVLSRMQTLDSPLRRRLSILV
jgi:hypothetical protein